MLLDICLVYLPGPVFCFFKIEVTESFEIPKIRPVARVPVQSIANFTTCLRTSGSYAFLVYSSTKLYRSHAGLLHRYTCFPALLCPFLLTLSLPQCGHLIVNVFVAIPLPTFPFSLFSFFVTSLQFLKDITNFYLHIFEDVQRYSDKKYGVWLEWHYTYGRAKKILEYIKSALEHESSIEIWHVWLADYYEYEESPLIQKCTVPFSDVTIDDIKEIDTAAIWNTPDRRNPIRPSFYCLVIENLTTTG